MNKYDKKFHNKNFTPEKQEIFKMIPCDGIKKFQLKCAKVKPI